MLCRASTDWKQGFDRKRMAGKQICFTGTERAFGGYPPPQEPRSAVFPPAAPVRADIARGRRSQKTGDTDKDDPYAHIILWNDLQLAAAYEINLLADATLDESITTRTAMRPQNR